MSGPLTKDGSSEARQVLTGIACTAYAPDPVTFIESDAVVPTPPTSGVSLSAGGSGSDSDSFYYNGWYYVSGPGDKIDERIIMEWDVSTGTITVTLR